MSTYQKIMSICQIMMSTCHIMMSTCQIMILTYQWDIYNDLSDIMSTCQITLLLSDINWERKYGNIFLPSLVRKLCNIFELVFTIHVYQKCNKYNCLHWKMLNHAGSSSITRRIQLCHTWYSYNTLSWICSDC